MTKQEALRVRADDERCDAVVAIDQAIAALKQAIAALKQARIYALAASQYRQANG